MSNKAWDLISYAESARISEAENERNKSVLEDALGFTNKVVSLYMKEKCSGYGVRCNVDCDAWNCPFKGDTNKEK